MLNLLKYYHYSLLHPEFRDYIDSGLGIEARRRRCARYWESHLRLSRDFQRKNLRGGSSIAVLGSGRLYDVDHEFLGSAYRRIDLYDADPLALRQCRKTLPAAERHLLDLTGSMTSWSRQLESSLKRMGRRCSPLDAAAFLVSLSPSEISLPPCSCILSLNLLSQIPLYWRDRCDSLLEKMLGLRRNAEDQYDEDAIELAVRASMRKLQEAHLAVLLNARADEIVIITDTAYLHYDKERPHWQSEAALLNREWPPAFSGYRLAGKDSWFWHILPQGVEKQAYGAIHEIQALYYLKIA